MATETSILESLDVRMARMEGTLPYLATREDISDLRGEMQGEIGSLRSELQGEIRAQGSKTDGEIGKLRGEVGELRGELKTMRWTMIWAVSLMGVGLGVLMLVLQ